MLTYTRRIAALAALASLGALASASGASAAVGQPAVNQFVLEVTADGEDDTIVLGVSNGGFITVNGTATGEAAGPDAQIFVDGGGGADTVDESALASGSYLESRVRGGEGDDLIIGGQAGDLLEGENGDDRL